MKISETGITLLKRFEGSVKIGDKHIVYDDQTGMSLDVTGHLPKGATIGYGHLIKDSENFNKGITEDIAIDLLRSDIVVAERVVKDNINVTLLQNQYDALVLLAYNIGAKNFATSTVVKYINNPNFHDAKYATLESAWKAWNKSQGMINKGLINRRNAEWYLFANNSAGYLSSNL